MFSPAEPGPHTPFAAVDHWAARMQRVWVTMTMLQVHPEHGVTFTWSNTDAQARKNGPPAVHDVRQIDHERRQPIATPL